MSPRASDPVERRRARLNEAREAPGSPACLAILRRGLGDRVQVVVARAAEIAAELELAALAPELEAAFHRLLEGGAKMDKGSLGKTAIVDALMRLDHPSADVFLRAIRHVQLEASWGPPVDTAAELRGLAATGLVRCGHPEAATHVVDLCADPEKAARIGAARALAELGVYEAALVLRLAVRLGDPEIEVTSERLSAYLDVAPPGEALALVDEILGGSDGAAAEVAAVALGTSKLESAFPVLRKHWEETIDPTLCRALTVAMALLRSNEANAHLIERIEAGDRGASARDALSALAPFLYADELRRRVERAVSKNGDPELARLLKESLPR